MNESALQTFLYTWINGLFSPQIPVVRDYQATPETEPWVAYAIQSANQIGYDDKRGLDSSFIQQYGGNRKAMIRVSYFGPFPMEAAQMIQTSLERESVIAAFKAAGVAYQKKNSINNLSYMLESRYQLRADFEMQVEYLDTYSEDNGYILTADVHGTYTGPGPTVTVDIVAGP